MIRRMNDNNKYNSKRRIAKSSKSNFKESYRDAVDYWRIPVNDAYDAYNFACEYFDKEELDHFIVECLSREELASCLGFIFKANNFTEYYEDDED